MSRRFLRFAHACALAAAVAAVLPARAEIIFIEGGGVAAAEAGYAYAHPALRSVVFAAPEYRQLAILPPAPVFVMPPPLLWRAPLPFPAYAPVQPGSSRPSNRDNVSYNLQRAHGFSQQLFNRDALPPVTTAAPLLLYPWAGALMPAYPPVAPGASHPSNRDNATYNLERAHRYSMDAYKKP